MRAVQFLIAHSLSATVSHDEDISPPERRYHEITANISKGSCSSTGVIDGKKPQSDVRERQQIAVNL